MSSTGTTQAELIKGVIEATGLKRREVQSVLDAYHAGITSGLQHTGKVTIRALGTFTVKDRPARKGTNPSTGESITIKASRKVALRIGKQLKEAVL